MFRQPLRAALLGALCCVTTLASAAEDRGLSVREEARQSGKFLLAFFFDQKTEAATNDALRASVQESAQALPKKTIPVYLDVDDVTQQGLVKEFNLRYAPRPIVLVFSPDGTMCGSFQKPFSATEMSQSLPGRGIQSALKALQERKLVFIRVESKKTVEAATSAEAVKAFMEDSRFKESTVQVIVDPEDPEEQNTLRQLQIKAPDSAKPAAGTGESASAATDQDSQGMAVLIMLAPPSVMVGRWDGVVTKEALVQGLMQTMSRSGGCGSSCADPSCPPAPKEGK